ncbi:2-dehydro-3-deoxygalactonokinase [Novosphingobium sp.]|uniref:2-dehydro-3-deoxygalactonokinase n=1 Tax=Novosphingobium sp. TaxID=1874826 RepID=UPI002626B2AC|nr:2-dehydro-3-deoxygalactonokinase [Novosphingobium sp.]
MIAQSFIAVEWGSAAIRARLVTDDGQVLDQTVEEVRLTDLDRPARLARIRCWRERWPDARPRVWLAGMIGSPAGLEPVDQVACPARPADIVRGSRHVEIDGIPLTILPGLACRSFFGDPDVLRGEEVAAVGLLQRGLVGQHVLLSVPGMHGKWMELTDGRIERFHTSMTVELFRALADRTILAPLMGGTASDGPAFRSGLVRGASGGGLGRLLFSVRSAMLAGSIAPEDTAAHLWGILIGADVRENLRSRTVENRIYHVTGAPAVAPLFCAALHHFGVEAELADGDQLSAAGFARLRAALVAEGVLA